MTDEAQGQVSRGHGDSSLQVRAAGGIHRSRGEGGGGCLDQGVAGLLQEAPAYKAEHPLQEGERVCVMGFCNQLPQTWRLNPAHIYSLTLPEARNAESVPLGGPRGVSRATSTQRLCFVAFPAPGASFPASWSLPPRSKPAASKPAAQQLQIFLTPSPIVSAFRYLPLNPSYHPGESPHLRTLSHTAKAFTGPRDQAVGILDVGIIPPSAQGTSSDVPSGA